ncbi:hypothetical protein SAMN06265375_101665 [Muriicola jejuensis]|uniref:Uncharacterized protein n=1 Tax=Muriicola jejuensis TaxID=504488 RepID=A0A6P0UI19_9FLAO|nr:DUF6090 family protein [Muriicola jejuensis]NER09816.1 hypothetical protein [Muriicola jejuensis]SMP05507.1 hypothetical protein SAMN06265375_101665 [Muriicola jejuensis]
MIKFFRKIRQQLLEENKFSKYLMYAIGEIVLVVIGILIALSINTWNEDRKTDIRIRDSLVALRNDLVQDTLQISERLPYIREQFLYNESLRSRVAGPGATVDTLLQIMRFEYNPNWIVQLRYNTNAYNSLNQTGLIENLPDSLGRSIKEFYNEKATRMDRVEKTTGDYQGKVTTYVNTYTFGATEIHDQGPLIDSLVWNKVDYAHLAATFQGISNFKRILFMETRKELELSLEGSREIIVQLDRYLR